MPLDPSERVLLIREISQRLGEEGYPYIDLVLNQFDCPTSDTWQGDRSDYVMGMIQRVKDETLQSLAKLVGFDFAVSQTIATPKFWRQGDFRLFISHLAKYKDEAAEFQIFLSRKGISSFVAHNDIEPTKGWMDEILSALETAQAMVALFREGFHQSNWTDQEIGYAMGRRLLIIAVRSGQDPYGFIGQFQALNGVGKEPEQLANGIYQHLG